VDKAGADPPAFVRRSPRTASRCLVLVGFIVVRSDGEGEHTICSAPSGLRITPVLGLPPKSSSRRAGTVLALCLSTYNRAAVYGLALGSDSF